MPFDCQTSRANANFVENAHIILVMRRSWDFLFASGTLISETLVLLFWNPENLIYSLSFLEGKIRIIVSWRRDIPSFLDFSESVSYWSFRFLLFASFPKSCRFWLIVYKVEIRMVFVRRWYPSLPSSCLDKCTHFRSFGLLWREWFRVAYKFLNFVNRTWNIFLFLNF